MGHADPLLRELSREAGTRLDKQPKSGKDIALLGRGRPPKNSGRDSTAVAVDVVEGHGGHVQGTINHHFTRAAATKTSVVVPQVNLPKSTNSGHREREQGGVRRRLPLAEGDRKRYPQQPAEGGLVGQKQPREGCSPLNKT